MYVEGIPLRLADEGAGRGPVRIVAAPATVALHRRRAGQVALSVGKLGGARAAPSAPPSPAGPMPSSGGLKRPRRATPRDRQPRIDVGGAPEHHAGGRVGAGRGRPRGSMNRAPPRGSAGVDLRTKALRELEPGGAGVLGGAFVGRSGEVEGGAGEVEGGAGGAPLAEVALAVVLLLIEPALVEFSCVGAAGQWWAGHRLVLGQCDRSA